jgi:hypothetical protein
MKWLTLSGREKNLNINHYRINWDKKAPSKGSQVLKDFFAKNCKNDIWLEEMRVPGCLLRCDFINLTRKICFEYDDKEDGGHHTSYNPFFHKNRIGYLNSIKRENKKEMELEKNGFATIHIYKEDLDQLSKTWFFQKFEIVI